MGSKSRNIAVFTFSKEDRLGDDREYSSLGTAQTLPQQWAHATYRRLVHLCGSENIASASLYTSPTQDALIFPVEPSQDLDLISVGLESNDSLLGRIQWRIYKYLPVSVQGAQQPRSDEGHILICVAMTPKPDNEEDFNRWYEEEHIPLLSRAPTWISSKRYRLVSSSDDVPHYLAIHAWGNASAFASTAYKQAIDTPWKWRVVGSVLGRAREEYQYAGELKEVNIPQ